MRADKAERLAERGERLAERADRHQAASDAAYAYSHSLVAGIPAGQPVLAGHHSESGHRRLLDRSWNALGRSVREGEAAESLRQRAEVAGRQHARSERVDVTQRRIERLEADLRGVQRNLDGYTRNHRNGQGEIYHTDVTPPATGAYRERLELQKAEIEANLAYDREMVAQAVANGAKVFTKADVEVGGAIRTRGHWRKVVRVNPKTVAVETGYSWTDKVPYNEIVAVRSAAEVAAVLAAAEAPELAAASQ